MQAGVEAVHCHQCGLASTSDAGFCQRCGAKLPAFAPAPVFDLSQPRYAGFWIRFVAALIDMIVLFSVLHLCTMLVASYLTISGLHNGLSTAKILAMQRSMRAVFSFFLGGLYRVGMESSEYQGTLGKLAMRIKVTDLAYQRLSLADATKRYLARFVSILTLGIGFVMAGFDNQKRALHDKLAETFVLYR